jgi:hypothetical protein
MPPLSFVSKTERGNLVPRFLNDWGQSALSRHAQKQVNRWPDDNATDRAWRDRCHAGFADDACGRKAETGGPAKARTDKNRRRPRREGEDNAAQFVAETTRGFEGLASGVNFPIQIAKIRQAYHRQAMLILFTRDVLFHQMPGKACAGTPRLGAVRKRAIDPQGAVDGQSIHGNVSGWFEPLIE